MAGEIIMCIISLICAFMFFGIGVYARKTDKPMGFWSGSEINASEITDIPKYNKENAIMWQVYSLFYFGSALAAIFAPIASAILLTLGCTIGLWPLTVAYNKIYKKYSVK